MYSANFKFKPHARLQEEEKQIDLDVTLDIEGKFTYHEDNGQFILRKGVDLSDDVKRQEMEARLNQSMDCTVNVFWAEKGRGIRYEQIDDFVSDLTAEIINDLKGGFCLNHGIALDDLEFTRFSLCDEDEKIYRTFCRELNKQEELKKIKTRLDELEADLEHREDNLAEISQLKRRFSEVTLGITLPEAAETQPKEKEENAGSDTKQAGAEPVKQPENEGADINPNPIRSQAAYLNNTPTYINRDDRIAPKTQFKWYCPCGKINDTNYCTSCGKPKEATSVKWICSCGAYVSTPFCTVCGTRRSW